MPVRVQTGRLRSRLARLARELPAAASAGLVALAESNIDLIKTQTQQDWSDHNQVGFDLSNFHTIISQVYTTGEGYGILSYDDMGTEEDFDAITESRRSGAKPGMWHVGTGQRESFRRLVYQRPDVASEVARLRNAVWGGKEPQWWLLNYGNIGYSGSFDPRPGTYSIESVAFGWGAADMDRIVSAAVNGRLRRVGILV